MATIRPLRALRPPPDLAARVASVPYDVVDTEEARGLAAGNPFSFLRVVRPEIDLPPDTDIHDPAVYAQGRAALEELVAQGALVRDPEPALYLYRQSVGGHHQVGVLGCCPVDAYDDGTIKKHEKTRPDKEADRARHVLTLSAQTGPIFLTYRPRVAIDRLVDEATRVEPLYDFTAPDGVAHTLWRLPRSEALAQAFLEVPALYIADGHHRAAAASRARAELRARHSDAPLDAPFNQVLAVLFPADQLRILPYNRVVHDLGEHTPRSFLDCLGKIMELHTPGRPSPDRRGVFSLFIDGGWYRVAAPSRLGEQSDPVARLDAAILQDHVLGPLLGIEDPRTSPRIDFVGGIRGSEELERRVRERGQGAAFALHPLSVTELMDVADAGRVLPPKSTWFEPKLRSGLVVHEL